MDLESICVFVFIYFYLSLSLSFSSALALTLDLQAPAPFVSFGGRRSIALGLYLVCICRVIRWFTLFSFTCRRLHRAVLCHHHSPQHFISLLHNSHLACLVRFSESRRSRISILDRLARTWPHSVHSEFVAETSTTDMVHYTDVSLSQWQRRGHCNLHCVMCGRQRMNARRDYIYFMRVNVWVDTNGAIHQPKPKPYEPERRRRREKHSHSHHLMSYHSVPVAFGRSERVPRLFSITSHNHNSVFSNNSKKMCAHKRSVSLINYKLKKHTFLLRKCHGASNRCHSPRVSKYSKDFGDWNERTNSRAEQHAEKKEIARFQIQIIAKDFLVFCFAVFLSVFVDNGGDGGGGGGDGCNLIPFNRLEYVRLLFGSWMSNSDDNNKKKSRIKSRDVLSKQSKQFYNALHDARDRPCLASS